MYSTAVDLFQFVTVYTVQPKLSKTPLFEQRRWVSPYVSTSMYKPPLRALIVTKTTWFFNCRSFIIVIKFDFLVIDDYQQKDLKIRIWKVALFVIHPFCDYSSWHLYLNGSSGLAYWFCISRCHRFSFKVLFVEYITQRLKWPLSEHQHMSNSSDNLIRQIIQ